MQKAKEIAFMHVGYSEAEVRELSTGYLDGSMIYEINFKVINLKFSYKIDAKTGDILQLDSDREKPAVTEKPTATLPASENNDKPSGTTSPTSTPAATAKAGSTYIGVQRAEDIAFKHAGVSRSQVHDLDTELDSDDGQKYYEVEFEVGDTEYDYEIDAYSGKILTYEIDD